MKYLKYFFNYIASFAYDLYYFFFGDIKSRIAGWKYYRQSRHYPDYLKRGEASAATLYLAQKYCIGQGVDIGSGLWPLPGARGIENEKEENAFKIKENDNSLDFVFSSHVLEHLDDWQKALKEWQRVLKNNGILFLYLPHPMVSMWQTGINKNHLWTPTPAVVLDYLENKLDMEIIDNSYLPDGYLSFYIIAKKR